MLSIIMKQIHECRFRCEFCMEYKTRFSFSFLQHNIPIFQRESYSFLVRNHSRLFSFPFPFSYLERRFIPKHNPHLFRVQRVFQSLGSFRDLPKEVGEVWQMQSGILRDLESQTRHGSKKPYWSKSLEGLSTLGRLGLEGFLLFVYPNLLLSSGSITAWRAAERFSQSFSVSSLITHRCVILCLHLSSLTLVLYFYCLLFMFMHQSSIC